MTAATWASYSVAVAPLMQRYSASRISAVVISLAWLGIAAGGRTADGGSGLRRRLGRLGLLLLATLGPLVLTTIIWFRRSTRSALACDADRESEAVRRRRLRGRAPVGGDEPTQVVGGALIGGGILLARRRQPRRPAGRRVTSAAMTERDYMPLDGWDHIELWVGNAKQAAYWYEHAFGFTRTAYAGPETGVRDRASYVLEQGEIRLVRHERPPRRQRDRPLRRPLTATARGESH